MMIKLGEPVMSILVSIAYVVALSHYCVAAGSWPRGTYGLPKPISGCPSSKSDIWKSGERTQQTEAGSIASANSQLDGTVAFERNFIIQSFCIKTASNEEEDDDDDNAYFMPGKYCILKKGFCPGRFQEGFIYWDDAASFVRRNTQQTKTGDLPDGEFNENTRVDYCCRQDGNPMDEIILPYDKPFYLMKLGDICQQVVGMDVAEHWVKWFDEKSFNNDGSSGLHPTMNRRNDNLNPYTVLYYCYYHFKSVSDSPAIVSSGRLHTVIVASYVIGSTVGFVLIISIILTAVQRALLIRQARASRDSCSSENDARSSLTNRLFYDTEGAGGGSAVRDQPPPYHVAVKNSSTAAATAAGIATAAAAANATATSTGGGSTSAAEEGCSSAAVSAAEPLVRVSGTSASRPVNPPSYTDVLSGKTTPRTPSSSSSPGSTGQTAKGVEPASG